jgi:hypothetical protein
MLHIQTTRSWSRRSEGPPKLAAGDNREDLLNRISEALHSPAVRFGLQNVDPVRERTMPTFIRDAASKSSHSSWTLPILVGIIIASLLGFIASRPNGASWVSKAAEAEFAGAELVVSEPAVVEAKKPVRYEAAIANWKRHRSAAKANE